MNYFAHNGIVHNSPAEAAIHQSSDWLIAAAAITLTIIIVSAYLKFRKQPATQRIANKNKEK